MTGAVPQALAVAVLFARRADRGAPTSSVVELDALTGLPEYRNGGLLVDSRGAAAQAVASCSSATLFKAGRRGDRRMAGAHRGAARPRLPTHVRLASRPRRSRRLPLVKVLEAGTWFAGRSAGCGASTRRRATPIAVESDGTVF